MTPVHENCPHPLTLLPILRVRARGVLESPAAVPPALDACPELLRWLVDADSIPQDPEARRLRQQRLAELRRDRLVRPAIFVGAGTCGLGAGAQATLDAVRAYLDAHEIKADVVKVGCIGLCSVEPIVDIQLPGRARVSFQQVTAKQGAAPVGRSACRPAARSDGPGPAPPRRR